MPNIIVRVKSLANEPENKTPICVNKSVIESIVARLYRTTRLPMMLGIIGPGLECVIKQLFSYIAHTPLQSPLRLHYFIAQASDLNSLAQLCQPFDVIVQQLDDIGISAVAGCHRVIGFDGALSIDVHIGQTIQALKQLTNAEQTFGAWMFSNTQAPKLDHPLAWQLARLSDDDASVILAASPNGSLSASMQQQLSNVTQLCGFRLLQWPLEPLSEMTLLSHPDPVSLDIAKKERAALRYQQQQTFAYNPLKSATEGNTAIIGGGVASGCLALSLAERGQALTLFCMDNAPGQQASGNKQGAIYPLLTPEDGPLSQFFLQGYLFSRQRINTLVKQGYNINHDFCGVLQTGHDARSAKRLHKIITARAWADAIAKPLTGAQASAIAGIEIGIDAIYYPLGGWVNPQQLTTAAIEQATTLSDVTCHFNTQVTAIERRNEQWYINAQVGNKQQAFGPFANLVLANGRHLTDFSQTAQLPISGFRGQVSHIPSRFALKKLTTVLCSHGYLTPAHDELHCTGASYIKDPDNLDYSATEQFDNLDKIRTSYQADWTQDVDISGHSARVGVRMVTRDHAPMMGCAPDYDAIIDTYQTQQHTKSSAQYWQHTQAPIHDGLFILGGLGSRGLTSGPLAAELLAAQMCGELIPTTTPILGLLNPNRMWMRKLIKGKALM
ncbi:FAD-dependent 5-carboxymethylaminomethyl-2-thiouridine(34) oxidoreductase MnmC [Shewanella algidipiscicola]|uniref:tRNA 5-methylaminomethyl-2-thiouridine biosynthesis bifunctional protein MnmC n=1 Tax=Shewanella algidipiscicola TaxID=614070 RepID=A0ABQ4NSM1_9GAMM|nr:FAD-dependent 5-carboxymethylaminomethyl-2-thiouridine(34) oxidoreductase MnmC [Shewanella algidipiscicola]GIU01906.1 tRNA 5-methylaminomethyl-2-thiouridine biosynthesis bifunctional protein MnmC [Shewanella algidipiscicola]